MHKKYEFTGEVHYRFPALKRIRALVDIPLHGVKAGDIGGWIEREDNLSHDGACWLGDGAQVRDDAYIGGLAVVSGQAIINEKAIVCGYAKVEGLAVVSGQARILDTAYITGLSTVNEDAVVKDSAMVCNAAHVCGTAKLKNNFMACGIMHLHFGIHDSFSDHTYRAPGVDKDLPGILESDIKLSEVLLSEKS